MNVAGEGAAAVDGGRAVSALDLLIQAIEEDAARLRLARDRVEEAEDMYRAAIETARRRLGLFAGAALNLGGLAVSPHSSKKRDKKREAA